MCTLDLQMCLSDLQKCKSALKLMTIWPTNIDHQTYNNVNLTYNRWPSDLQMCTSDLQMRISDYKSVNPTSNWRPSNLQIVTIWPTKCVYLTYYVYIDLQSLTIRPTDSTIRPTDSTIRPTDSTIRPTKCVHQIYNWWPSVMNVSNPQVCKSDLQSMTIRPTKV